MKNSWFSVRLQVLAVLLAAYAIGNSAEPPPTGFGSGRQDVVSREFRMGRVANERRSAGPPPDYRAEAVEYLARGDAGDEVNTLFNYGGAEARAALYAADQVAKQTELMAAQTELMARQAAAMEGIAARLTEMVYGKP